MTEQIKIVETLLKAFADAPVQEGDIAYVVSRSWLDKALALRTGGPKKAKTESQEGPLGPVDNTDIIQETFKQPDGSVFTRLRPGIGLESYELFPEDAWAMVRDWYGIVDGQEPIKREAIDTSDASETNIIFEVNPLVFRVHRLWSELSPLPIEQSLKAKNPPTLVVATSRKAVAQKLLKEIKTLAGIPMDRKVRIIQITPPIPAANSPAVESALTPPLSPNSKDAEVAAPGIWPHLLLENPTFTALPREMRQASGLIDHTVNSNYNGKSSLLMNNLVTDCTLVLDEAIDKTSWVSTYTGKTSKGLVKSISSRTSSARSSPAPDGIMTRGRMQKKKFGRGVGSVGLHNLGNTCYMNSALQCVRSVEELTKFFLTDAYMSEINKTNLLGYHGKVAMAYGTLLKEIYAEGRGSVSPRDFKATVGRCRSTFSGWGQQDSQEFLGFLLDALQEDLSRVKNKPYIEKPDSTDDMINDPEAIRQMAEKVWDITRQRDDSVIADLFTGMYKSTLKCPECGKISITFDPFNNLTLPLPMENMWTKAIKFYPLNDVPVKLEVELPKHSSIEALKQYLSIRLGVPVDRLMGAEEFKGAFFKMYDDTMDISEEISSSDVPTFHELEAKPTNWPDLTQRKKPRSMLDIDSTTGDEWEDNRYDVIVVPVFHRRPSNSSRIDGASPPHFITLTREEARSEDSIRRKVLERVATFSTWPKFKEIYSSDQNGHAAGNGSDVESGDADVAARSVEGEDDMVDVSMNDDNYVAPNQPKLLKQFNHKRPDFIKPGSFLDPELQNLFSLSYFYASSDGALATGWNALDNGRALPKISDRVPQAKADEEETTSADGSNSSQSGNEDSSNEDEGSQNQRNQTRMADESSEEEMEQLYQRPLHNHMNQKPGAGGRKKFKEHKTYGKKGNKRRAKHMRGNKANAGNRMPNVAPQPMPPAVADGGPLIRLSEGLVVDWNEDAWDTLFGLMIKTADSTQGAKTFTNLESLEDTALKISQRRRQSRKSRGITLEECLDEFERAEILSEEDMWYCPRCKEHRRASKKFDLWKTPDYLVAHLKRFSSSGWRRDKLDVLVEFPIDGLDLTSRVIQTEEGKSEIYDLIGVDDHYGGLGGGHYTAYAKNFVDGKWYNYNDSSVSAVSDPSSVVTTAAYLLFYKRRSSGPLGGERFRQILEKFDRDSQSDNSDGESEAAGDGRGWHPPLKHDTSDDELPAYGKLSNIRSSVEGGGNSTRKSLDLTQGWTFGGLNGDGDAASDAAQADSSGDEGADNQMITEADASTVDIEMGLGPNSSQAEAEEVAEILLEE